jgi:tetratricopeptide (TPR) repeat protein
MRTEGIIVLIGVMWMTVTAAAKGPEPAKPKAGDGGGSPAKTEPEDPARRRIVDSQNARDKADLLRAKYEAEVKPGPVPKELRERFDEIVRAYRAAIDIDPRGEVATYCRQRLAGAYTYAQDFDAALRVHVEAVNVAAGALEQVRACHGAGYHCLQAMHRPAEALRWFRRAEALIEKIEDPEERAKWRVATAEGVGRCEAEWGK